MGAILVMPAEVRAARFSRELDRFVIEALSAVKRQGGDQAFNRTARDLVISVCAILAYERGDECGRRSVRCDRARTGGWRRLALLQNPCAAGGLGTSHLRYCSLVSVAAA